jgi:hypothetical protein
MPVQNEARKEDTGRVVMFPARGSLGKGKPRLAHGREREAPVADLGKYEQSAEPDDYGRRMAINVAAFAVIVLLTVAGIWLAEQLALLRKHSDCALLSHKYCADFDVPLRNR